jgi:hypothetical protein
VNLNNAASNANWNNGVGVKASIKRDSESVNAPHFPTPLAVEKRIAGD